MTYEEYQQAIIANQEAMAKTREAEAERHRELSQEFQKIQREAKAHYLDILKMQEQLYQQRVRNNREYWRAERNRLYREIHLKIALWKRQNGITPPYIETEGGQQGKEVSDGDRQE